MLKYNKKVYVCLKCNSYVYPENGNQPLQCSNCKSTRIRLCSEIVTKEK